MSPVKHDSHDIIAEKSVLGCCLVDQPMAHRVSKILCPQDFYDQRHKLIFTAITDLLEQWKPVDIDTVTAWLEKENGLALAGGAHYIHSLALLLPSALNAVFYAEIVRDHAKERRQASTDTTEDVVDAQVQPSASEQVTSIVEELEQQLARAHSRNAELKDQLNWYKNARESLITERDELQAENADLERRHKAIQDDFNQHYLETRDGVPRLITAEDLRAGGTGQEILIVWNKDGDPLDTKVDHVRQYPGDADAGLLQGVGGLIAEDDVLAIVLLADAPEPEPGPSKRYSFSQAGLGPYHGAVFPDGTVHTNTDLVHGPIMTPPEPEDSPIQVRGFRSRPLRTPVTAVWKGASWSFTPSIPTNGGRVNASDTGITNWVPLTPNEGEGDYA